MSRPSGTSRPSPQVHSIRHKPTNTLFGHVSSTYTTVFAFTDVQVAKHVARGLEQYKTIKGEFPRPEGIHLELESDGVDAFKSLEVCATDVGTLVESVKGSGISVSVMGQESMFTVCHDIDRRFLETLYQTVYDKTGDDTPKPKRRRKTSLVQMVYVFLCLFIHAFK